jgi:RNA-directed DNA polymerase
MTHGPEKSELSIGAMKLANKPGQPAAESVERRERAEGNTGEQHMRRTQSRESVSQGLDRVRKAAQQKWPSVRFAVKHPRWEPGA